MFSCLYPKYSTAYRVKACMLVDLVYSLELISAIFPAPGVIQSIPGSDKKGQKKVQNIS